MPWVRIDDHFDEHPKLAAVGPLAWGVWLAGIAYCNRNLTDGFIPRNKAHSLCSFEYIDEEYRVWTLSRTCGLQGYDIEAEWIIDNLIVGGLWDTAPGGYQIHDYSDFQPTKEHVLAERAKKQAAGKAGGQASARARAKASGEAEREAPAKADSKPVPVPKPVPENPLSSSSITRERDAPETDDDAEGSTLYLKVKTELLKSFEEEDARAALTVWWPRQSTGETFTSPLSFCSRVAKDFENKRVDVNPDDDSRISVIEGEKFCYDHDNGHWHRVEAEVVAS